MGGSLAPVEWRPIVDDENVSIAVAPLDALLAMKLLSVPRRPGRDTNDVVNLLVLNSIRSVEEAEHLFESFYPGDGLERRSLAEDKIVYDEPLFDGIDSAFDAFTGMMRGAHVGKALVRL